MPTASSTTIAGLRHDLAAIGRGRTRRLRTAPWLVVTLVAYLRELAPTRTDLDPAVQRITDRCENPRDDWDRLIAAWIPALSRVYAHSQPVRDQLRHSYAGVLFREGIISHMSDEDTDTYEAWLSADTRAALGNPTLQTELPDRVFRALSPTGSTAGRYLESLLTVANNLEPHLVFAAHTWPQHQVIGAFRSILASPAPDYTAGTILDACLRLRIPGCSEDAVRVIRRLDLTTDNPFAATRAADYLLWSGDHVEEAADCVRRCAATRMIDGYRGNPQRDTYATLALTYRNIFTPEETLAFIRDAQRDSPANRDAIAVVLAWINQPWALRELLDPTDRGPHQTVRAAFRLLRGERIISLPAAPATDDPRLDADETGEEWTPEQWQWNDDRLLDRSIERMRPELDRITDLSDPAATTPST